MSQSNKYLISTPSKGYNQSCIFHEILLPQIYHAYAYKTEWQRTSKAFKITHLTLHYYVIKGNRTIKNHLWIDKFCRHNQRQWDISQLYYKHL